MHNKYQENEVLRKVANEARAMFSSYCDATTQHDKFQKEENAEGMSPFGLGCNFNTASMMRVLPSANAHMEFLKAQAK